MSESTPTFSVVVPTYNRAALIGATLATVLAQTDADLELIVVDDGSTDATEAVVHAIADARLRYTRVANGERGRARNVAARLSAGRYITFLDSDDLWLPQHLAEARALIARHQSPPWCCLPYLLRSAAGVERAVRYSGSLRQALIGGNLLSCMGVFLRRDIALAHPFDEQRELSGSEDWLLWLRLAARHDPPYGQAPTAVLVDHASRSVRADLTQGLLRRTQLLVEALRADAAVRACYGARGIRRVEAHMLTYSALHLAMAGQRAPVLPLLLRAARCAPTELLSRRTLAIAKRLIFAPPPAR